MITKEQIQEKIGKLKIEQASLQTLHDNMVRDFQAQQQNFNQTVVAHQNRFQQLTGAIAQLSELLKTFEPPPDEVSKPA